MCPRNVPLSLLIKVNSNGFIPTSLNVRICFWFKSVYFIVNFIYSVFLIVQMKPDGWISLQGWIKFFSIIFLKTSRWAVLTLHNNVVLLWQSDEERCSANKLMLTAAKTVYKLYYYISGVVEVDQCRGKLWYDGMYIYSSMTQRISPVHVCLLPSSTVRLSVYTYFYFCKKVSSFTWSAWSTSKNNNDNMEKKNCVILLSQNENRRVWLQKLKNKNYDIVFLPLSFLLFPLFYFN